MLLYATTQGSARLRTGQIPELTSTIEASGLCHTDIHAAHGDWPVKPRPPFVPGHEGVGTVHAIGDGVTGLEAGDVLQGQAPARIVLTP